MRALSAAVLGLAVGCSVDRPRPLDVGVGTVDGGLPGDSSPTDPCDPPAEGCPCWEAGVGSQVYCGVVYRTSGDHVDCSKGYRTCGEDGGWGACEGIAVWAGD